MPRWRPPQNPCSPPGDAVGAEPPGDDPPTCGIRGPPEASSEATADILDAAERARSPGCGPTLWKTPYRHSDGALVGDL